MGISMVSSGGAMDCARLYLDLKFIILTRASPSPLARPIAPIGGG